MITDPKTLALALLEGLIPSLIWLWFWLKEDQKKYEPRGLLAICFVVGMLAVIFVLPVEKLIQTFVNSQQMQIIGWAVAEEIIKFLAVMLVVYKINYTDEPIDWPIYFITTALGFAALENMLFLIKPISLNQTTIGLITSNLRFLGATLLHAVSSGIIGIAMGLSLHMGKSKKYIYVSAALILAIALHSLFNFFIMKSNGSNVLEVFGFLWVATIIIMILFEKIRRMSGEI